MSADDRPTPEEFARFDAALASLRPGAASYRVGRKLGRTVYRVTADGDELIGVMDTPELGALVVAALNRDADDRHNGCCSMGVCVGDRDCPGYASCTLGPEVDRG